MFHVTSSFPSGLGMKPESIPPSIFLQGSSNVDCVAEWFFCMNLKTIMSPMFAVIDSGVKPSTGAMPVSTAFKPPTVTYHNTVSSRYARGDGTSGLTVCVALPLSSAGATLMTDIIWAAARPAASGSAKKYFIMTRFGVERVNAPALQANSRELYKKIEMAGL